MKKNICLAVLTIVLLLPVSARAASALETVEGHVKQLIAVLGDQALNTPAGEEQKKASIRSIGDSLFDFTELSRFALGANWKNFTPDQQKTFVDLYRRLLEKIYMGRLLQYKDEKVLYKSETPLSATRSEVQTDIVTDGGNIPIDYRLIRKAGDWKVYDLVIENASLARNYRVQFNSILAKDSPDKLLDMLREKVKEPAASAK